MTIADLLGRPSKLLLCFHAVDDSWPDPGLCVPVAGFEAAVSHLEQAGYRGETFSTVVAAPPDERLVAVTFDDAFESVATAAAPILEATWGGRERSSSRPPRSRATGCPGSTPRSEQRHLTATRQLGRGAPLRPRRAGLGGRKPLAHFTRCCRASPTQTPGEELAVSRDVLRLLVGTCDSISQPVGRGGRPSGRGVPPRRIHGRVGPERPVHMERPDARTSRVAVSAVDDSVRFALKVSGAHWHLRATGVWPAVEALRGMSGKRDEAPAPWRQRAVALPQPPQPPLGPQQGHRRAVARPSRIAQVVAR